VIFKQGYHWI